MISTIMVYKFTSLTRTKVEAMIGITLQQTRVYQYAKAEGDAWSMIIRRVGTLSSEVNAAVVALPLAKLEDLGDALLDFTEVADLINWLQTN
jgi:predicted transposase YdaD